MGKIKNKVGRIFGRLTVLSLDSIQDGAVWLCQCACGHRAVVHTDELQSGDTVSCGCLRRETAYRQGKRNVTHGSARQKRHTRAYVSWAAMKTRCGNPNAIGYHCYGGRGIRVCERWNRSFAAFLDDMGPRPKGKTLDRIDVNGNYGPSNCRWATNAEQQKNKRKTS